MSILGFEKNETKIVFGIFAILIFLMLLNYRVSLRRQRDSQRKQDVRDTIDAISVYQVKHGFIPTPSQYLPFMLKDPTKARSYIYQNINGKVIVYAALEGKDEAEYDSKIEAMHLPCGNYYC